MWVWAMDWPRFVAFEFFVLFCFWPVWTNTVGNRCRYFFAIFVSILRADIRHYYGKVITLCCPNAASLVRRKYQSKSLTKDSRGGKNVFIFFVFVVQPPEFRVLFSFCNLGRATKAGLSEADWGKIGFRCVENTSPIVFENLDFAPKSVSFEILCLFSIFVYFLLFWESRLHSKIVIWNSFCLVIFVYFFLFCESRLQFVIRFI